MAVIRHLENREIVASRRIIIDLDDIWYTTADWELDAVT